MPRRTNIFQKLILLLNEQLSGEASVTESAELQDAVTGEHREVDILIQGNIGDYIAIVAVECVDWQRKADVTWVEKMFQKHQHLASDKVVLVSRTGFTKPSYEKAKFYNIEALSLETAENSDWLEKLHAIQMTTWQLEIVSHEIQLLDTVNDAKIEPPVVFCDPYGNHYNLIQLLQSDVVSNQELTKYLYKLFSETDQTNEMILAIDITTGKFRDWYVPDDKDNKHKIHWYRMYVRIQKSDVTGEIIRANFRGKNVAYATLVDKQEDTILAFVEGADGEITVRSDIVSHKPKSGKTVLARYQFFNNQPWLARIEGSE